MKQMSEKRELPFQFGGQRWGAAVGLGLEAGADAAADTPITDETHIRHNCATHTNRPGDTTRHTWRVLSKLRSPHRAATAARAPRSSRPLPSSRAPTTASGAVSRLAAQLSRSALRITAGEVPTCAQLKQLSDTYETVERYI